MILPTDWTPKDKVSLFDGVTLEPHKRVEIKKRTMQSYHDSVLVGGYKNMAVLKLWVTFHTFTFSSGCTARQFVREGIGEDEMSMTDQPLANFIDYDKPLPHVYFFDNESFIGDKNKTYSELYKLFTEQSKENIDLVKNYLNDFGAGSTRLGRLISDPTYWQMMVYYSIVEKIIGQPEFCSNQHKCEVCKRENIQHRPISQAKWLRQRLGEIIGDEETVKHYEAIIFAVRQNIRHDTVHNAIIPSAEQMFKTEPGVTVYDLKRSIGDYDKDHSALSSLLHMLNDVSRYLLLDRLYGLQIFPHPRPLNVLTITEPGVPMSANPDHYK